MACKHFVLVLAAVMFLQGQVLGDGYPKESPAGGPTQGVSPAASTQSPPEASPATPTSTLDLARAIASGYPYSLGSLYPLYPPVSLDYASRWYGPTATPVVLADGHIADTPAVAAARAAHLAALERAKALWYGGKDDGSYNPYKYTDLYNYLSGFYGYAQGPLNRPYFGPLASPTVLPSGYLADTPATAAARAAHLAALVRARADAALWRAKGHGWQ